MKSVSCDLDALIGWIRENLGDCDEGQDETWSDEYILGCIEFAIMAVARANKSEFTSTVDVRLVNDSCVQSACKKCEGVVSFPANVNGNCEKPRQNLDESDSWYDKMYQESCTPHNNSSNYKISSIEIVSEGGCEFTVNPPVPKTGIFTLPVTCFSMPSTKPPYEDSICRHFDEVMLLSMAYAYMLEDDRETQAKASVWLDIYFKLINKDLIEDQNQFIRSLIFGKSVNPNNERYN